MSVIPTTTVSISREATSAASLSTVRAGGVSLNRLLQLWPAAPSSASIALSSSSLPCTFGPVNHLRADNSQ